VLQRPLEPEQYTAIRFIQRLADAGIRPSMGSVGDSVDNALAENFFSTLKVELVYRTSSGPARKPSWRCSATSTAGTTQHPIQQALGWRSPDEFEADYYRSLEAATPAGAK
jgi:putative transposase